MIRKPFPPLPNAASIKVRDYEANKAKLEAADAVLTALKRLHKAVGETGWQNAAPLISERERRRTLLKDAVIVIARAEAAGIK